MSAPTPAAIAAAAAAYPRRVSGPYTGCKHPADLLTHCLSRGGQVGRYAANYVASHHGACFNSMVGAMDGRDWIVWYCGLPAPAVRP